MLKIKDQMMYKRFAAYGIVLVVILALAGVSYKTYTSFMNADPPTSASYRSISPQPSTQSAKPTKSASTTPSKTPSTTPSPTTSTTPRKSSTPKPSTSASPSSTPQPSSTPTPTTTPDPTTPPPEEGV